MGKPLLKFTNIYVKMANGIVSKPIGMLQDIKIKVLDIVLNILSLLWISPNNLVLMIGS